MKAASFDPDRRLAEILAVHFDPDFGAPYWLDQARRLGFDPRERIGTVADLAQMPLMDQDAMRQRPLEDFLPRSVTKHPEQLLFVQTGGTLGDPLWTAYTDAEFIAAFVEPFVAAAGHVGFPKGGRWLYVGPSGPHVIGRAAEAIARATGSSIPFTVDFDVRWAKKLPEGSFGAQRYLRHVVDQAIAIIDIQDITKVFTTPAVLDALALAMTAEQRSLIRGVHYGGMALEPERLRRFQTELFPQAVHLSGYGNTLFGCCLELDVSAGRELRYFPHGDRLFFGLLPDDGAAPVYGAVNEAGRLVFSRLDRAVLLINVAERDRACLVAPKDGSPPGFVLPGVESPAPLSSAGFQPIASLY